jgi:uncharacterized protein (DUF488 family)
MTPTHPPSHLTGKDGGDDGVFTIGYGDRTSEDFVALLRAHRISSITDVRSQPYSKFQPEYSREALTAILARAGIRYLFLGDALGGRPEDPSCYTDGKVDYDKCRAKDLYLRGIDRVMDAHRAGHRFALMCSEKAPESCHRSKLLGQTLCERGVAVVHIDQAGAAVPHAEVIRRLTGGQATLFGDSFLSRGRYEPGPNPSRG